MSTPAPFGGYANFDDLSVIGAAINERKTEINAEALKSQAGLQMAFTNALTKALNGDPSDTADTKVQKRIVLTTALTEILETRGLDGLVQALHMAPATKPTSTPVASLGASTTTPDPVDPETARKLAIADSVIAGCGGNVDIAERNAASMRQYLANAQFMRYVQGTFSEIHTPGSGVYVMDDPATKATVLSTTHKAEQERDAYRNAFETLLAELFGAGKLPTGDRSKQLSAAQVKLSSMTSAGTSSEAAELYRLITSKEAHDPKKETVSVYLARVEGLFQTMGARTALTETGTKLGLDWKKDAAGKVIESPEDFMNRIVAKLGGGNIGDFLDTNGKAVKMTRNTGESDEDYATRIFGMAARDHKTFVDMYAWLKKLGVDTDLMDKTDAFTLFRLYVEVHNAGVQNFNELGGVAKARTTLKKHPVPTAS